MIETGDYIRPDSMQQFSDDAIAELVRRADAGDERALATLLELAESMLLDGALGFPVEPGTGPH